MKRAWILACLAVVAWLSGCASPPEAPKENNDVESRSSAGTGETPAETAVRPATIASESMPVHEGDSGAHLQDAASMNQTPHEGDHNDRSPVLHPFEGVTVNVQTQQVEVAGRVCWPPEPLEQVACAPESREHESLLSIAVVPSNIHAAMLLAGYESGSPGSWTMEGRQIRFIRPSGSEVDLFVRFERDGETITQPVREWIVDEQGQHTFMHAPWVFGGSHFKPNEAWMGPGEHYVADVTGSIVGLVTFADETIGFSDVISDLTALRATEWFADLTTMPPEGTQVTLIIKPYQPEDAPPSSGPAEVTQEE